MGETETKKVESIDDFISLADKDEPVEVKFHLFSDTDPIDWIYIGGIVKGEIVYSQKGTEIREEYDERKSGRYLLVRSPFGYNTLDLDYAFETLNIQAKPTLDRLRESGFDVKVEHVDDPVIHT